MLLEWTLMQLMMQKIKYKKSVVNDVQLNNYKQY